MNNNSTKYVIQNKANFTSSPASFGQGGILKGKREKCKL
jgi:hypothetical protein